MIVFGEADPAFTAARSNEKRRSESIGEHTPSSDVARSRDSSRRFVRNAYETGIQFHPAVAGLSKCLPAEASAQAGASVLASLLVV
jgi:hypothetical protein